MPEKELVELSSQSRLLKLLDLVQSSDEKLAWDACEVLKFFFERECFTGDASWLKFVESYLVLNKELAAVVGFASIKDLRFGETEGSQLAFKVLSRIEQDVANPSAHAYILKNSGCVPGLQNSAAVYLRSNWKKNEDVSERLLHAIWSADPFAEFEATLSDMAENALTHSLRETALQHLRVLSDLRNYQDQNPTE